MKHLIIEYFNPKLNNWVVYLVIAVKLIKGLFISVSDIKNVFSTCRWIMLKLSQLRDISVQIFVNTCKDNQLCQNYGPLYDFQ